LQASTFHLQFHFLEFLSLLSGASVLPQSTNQPCSNNNNSNKNEKKKKIKTIQNIQTCERFLLEKERKREREREVLVSEYIPLKL
jgi:hypothetical protein